MIAPFLPMLATSAQPFDSPDYSFEVKWDGVRALAAVAAGRWQLWGRALADYGPRYPELDVLRRLPAGTVVDGELVVARGGLPDLQALLRRHQRVGPRRIGQASRQTPVGYVLFDLLYHQGRPLLHEPLQRRRGLLAEVLAGLQEPGLVFSEGVVGPGRDFFARLVAQGHEGVVAKHLASRYLPGQRSSAWRKVKPVRLLPCVIIGYTPAAAGFRSLLVAAADRGGLRYVGQVRSGFTGPLRAELGRRLARRRRPRPVVACPRQAVWVEPELYCQVQLLGWTAHGHLRGASFRGVLAEGA